MEYGQVVVTEGDRDDVVSQTIASATGDWATHTFMVSGLDELVEAWFPRVRTMSLLQRVEELERNDRAYAVLDYHALQPLHRRLLVARARSFRGRLYDWPQALVYSLFRDFWRDGPKRLVCSRLITAAYQQALGVELFPEHVLRAQYPSDFRRQASLRKGYALPSDLLRSRLTVMEFRPSARIQRVEDLV